MIDKEFAKQADNVLCNADVKTTVQYDDLMSIMDKSGFTEEYCSSIDTSAIPEQQLKVFHTNFIAAVQDSDMIIALNTL